MDQDECDQLLLTGCLPERTEYLDRQIERELARVFRAYELEGKAWIRYDRTALFASGDTGLRLTFDENIRGNRPGEGRTSLLEDGLYILEVKGQNSVPFWMSALLSRNGIYKHRFSKYGREYSLKKEYSRKKVV